MSSTTVPYDVDAERALVSSMLISRDATARAVQIVCAGDNYSPVCAAMFDAAVALHETGVHVDATTVADELRRRGVLDSVGGPGAIADVAAFGSSSVAVDKYAEIVVKHAARRRLLAAAAELARMAQAGDPAEVIDAHMARLATIDLPAVGNPSGLMMLDDLLDRPEEQRSPWVVPGLIRRNWRVGIVAAEGVGKSLLMQQIAMCASQGVHPLALQSGYRPVTTLLVDAENPDDRILDGCAPIRDAASLIAQSWSPRTWLWHRPSGIDLRSRRDRATLEDVLERVRPELVAMGPVYKLAEKTQREGWDEVARALQTVLDDLRTRHNFALIFEDHAPQSDRGVRDLRPFGSSLWLRWPELGIKLVRKDAGGDVTVGHWRGARLKHSWPDELHRGTAMSMPWVGYWRAGIEEF